MVLILAFVTIWLVQISTEHAIEPRITNGENAAIDQFKFVVSIQLILPPYVMHVHICAGTVLDKYWILSSAVCVEQTVGFSTASVKINMYYTEKEDSRAWLIRIAKRIIHEHFDRSKNNRPNDIALLKLDKEISNPVAAKLPGGKYISANAGVMIGWGIITEEENGSKPEVLQYALTRIVDNHYCGLLLNFTRQLLNCHICTDTPSRPITANFGDAGGPIIQYVDGEPEVIGIISWTVYPVGQIGSPTISTRVSHFIHWIDEKTRKIPNKMSENNDLLTPLLVDQ